jgi:hypothetical protein
MFKRIFFFEENREVLLLQKAKDSTRRYKFDYIFSDYENNILIANSIKNIITNLIHNEKNLCFFTFGEEKLGKIVILKLGKTKFLFGNSNKIFHDSFFRYTVDIIEKVLRKEFTFDNILIDIVKVANEKFVLDYVKFY